MNKRIVIWFSTILISFMSMAAFAHSSDDVWRGYIDGTIGKNKYYLYEEARSKYFNPTTKYRALDLGAGSGNEVIDMVASGWDVVAMDNSERSGEVIQERAKGFKGSVAFQKGDFSRLALSGNYDFVMSILALPFGNKKDLPWIMRDISQHMKKGSVFIMTFFGYEHDFVKHGTAYGMNKEEVLRLLMMNQYNVAYFLNRVYNQKDFDGNQVHWDVLDIIGIKT